ncbi:MAG: cation transporting ATPase C-terminal domain-containing protein [Gammaproteobacteria bacterium]
MIEQIQAQVFLKYGYIIPDDFLSDMPAMSIAGDNVDRDRERTPHRRDIRVIRNYMITFGLVSTVFDLLTFGVLLYLAGEVAEIFRTGWCVESLLTELLILFVIRTYKPFYRSRPGRFLVWSTSGVAVLALLLPYLPLGAVFGFVPLPATILVSILFITVLYVVTTELVKRAFFRHFIMHHG